MNSSIGLYTPPPREVEIYYYFSFPLKKYLCEFSLKIIVYLKVCGKLMFSIHSEWKRINDEVIFYFYSDFYKSFVFGQKRSGTLKISIELLTSIEQL